MSNKISPSHILKKTESGKYYLVKVKQVIPSESVKDLTNTSSINASSTQAIVIGQSFEIRRNSDENTSLLQRDIKRLESVLEKVLYISLISIVLSCIILCLS